MTGANDFPELPAGVAVAAWDGARLLCRGPGIRLPVFSVTKMFVAAAVLRLAEQGRLELDACLADVVPAAPAGATVRDALRHTAGLGDYTHAAPYADAVADAPADPWPLDRIVAASTADPAPAGRRLPPAGSFSYSNVGYWLLGDLLERVQRGPLPVLLRELVFAPSGMASARYPTVAESLTPAGYSTLWAGPAGACWSSAADLVRFLRSPGLAPASFSLMVDAVPVDAGDPWIAPGYGLGAMVDSGRGTWGHGGGGPGYSSAAFAAGEGGRCAAVIAPESSGVDPVRCALDFLARGD